MVEYPGEELTFLADSMLKKLAKYLRALGYDTVFHQSAKDKALLQQAMTQNRVLLTRDKALYNQLPETYGYYLESQHTERQLLQLAEVYCISLRETDFLTRCLECNTIVEEIPKPSVKNRVPQRVYEYHDGYKFCPFCKQIFWQGGHVERLREKLERIFQSDH